MTGQVKFGFSKTIEKKVVKEDAPDIDFISNSEDIKEAKPVKSSKKKALVIKGSKNAWCPSEIMAGMDDLTKEAINSLLTNPEEQTLAKTIGNGEDEIRSSLQFPGVEPQAESTLDDYDDVPVTDFGAALMRGMGWEEGKGVGRNRQVVKPLDFDTRKRTLGVTVLEEENAAADLIMHDYNLGDYVCLTTGKNKDKTGKVLSIALETARCVVRLPSEELVDCAVITIKKSTREEFFKQRDQLNEVTELMGEIMEKKPKIKRDPDAKPTESRKRIKQSAWLHRDLKVRVVSEDFKKGKYYCKKVDIVDIVDPFTCTCKSESGRLLYEVPQTILETVVPKKVGSLVMVLSDENKYEVAELAEKDAKAGEVICITLEEKDVLTLKFDQVCEYVGDAIR